MNLFVPFWLFDDLFEEVDRPVYPDECFPPGAVLAGAGEAAEVASSQASFLVTEEELESF